MVLEVIEDILMEDDQRKFPVALTTGVGSTSSDQPLPVTRMSIDEVQPGSRTCSRIRKMGVTLNLMPKPTTVILDQKEP